MSRWGRCDFSQFREFAKGFEKLSDSEIDDLCVACSKELAARLLALVIPRSASTRKAPARKAVLSVEAGALRTAKPGASMRNP